METDTAGRSSLCSEGAHIFVDPFSVCDCGQKIRDNYADFSLNYSNYPITEDDILKEISGMLRALLKLVKELRDDKEGSSI